MLEPERHSERVAVYVTPSFRERLTRTIGASGVEQSHWLRRVLEAEIFRFELGETQEQEANAPDRSRDPSVPPAVALAAAEARIEGMQEIVNLQRERLGMGRCSQCRAYQAAGVRTDLARPCHPDAPRAR